MEEDKLTTSREVFSEVQMKAIADVVRGLLEEAFKDHVHVGALQLENSCRTIVPSK